MVLFCALTIDTMLMRELAITVDPRHNVPWVTKMNLYDVTVVHCNHLEFELIAQARCIIDLWGSTNVKMCVRIFGVPQNVLNGWLQFPALESYFFLCASCYERRVCPITLVSETGRRPSSPPPNFPGCFNEWKYNLAMTQYKVIKKPNKQTKRCWLLQTKMAAFLFSSQVGSWILFGLTWCECLFFFFF